MTLKSFLLIAFAASIICILVYIPSLVYVNANVAIFHVAYLTSTITLSLLLVGTRSRISFRTRFLLILMWILTLRLMLPLRLPLGILTSGPDLIYQMQIVNHMSGSGRVTFSGPTRWASNYAGHPILELVIAETGIVSGVSFETIAKYMGSFLGCLTMVFLFRFFCSCHSKDDALISVFLAGSCFWFIDFDAATVHQTLAWVFMALLLSSLVKVTKEWKYVAVLCLFMVVSTHHFTSIVGSFVFVVAAAFALLFQERAHGLMRLRTAILSCVMTSFWIVYISYYFFGSLSSTFLTVLRIFASMEGEMQFALLGKETVAVPLWTRLMGDIGLILFGLTCTVGFLLAFRERTSSRFKWILPFAAAGASIVVIALLTYSRYTAAPTLLPRGMLYVYYLAAPLSVFAISKASSLMPSRRGRRLFYASMLALIAVSAVYYNSEGRYDNTLPLNIEDVRFPLYEWKSAGFFAKDHISRDVTLWGDNIAFSYVGGYGELEVVLIEPELNLSLVEWMSFYPSSGDMIILRRSMPSVQYFNYRVDEGELCAIIAGNNILHASGEIVMLKKA